MTFVDADELPEGVVFDYHIDGGFNNNAVIVTWKIQDASRYRIRWVALKTFTGMQLKYIMPKKFPPWCLRWPLKMHSPIVTRFPARNAHSAARAVSSSMR